jgi:CRP-like cAMP-binding protein
LRLECDDPVAPPPRATTNTEFAGELTLLQLRSVPLFNGCDDGELAEVAAVSGERRYAVGDTLATAGLVVRDVPIVLDGYAGAELQGRPALVLGPGTVIGGPEALDGGLHPLTVVAQTAMVVRTVSAPDFATLIARIPPLAIGLIRQLGRRTRTVLDELACAGQGPVVRAAGSCPGPGARTSSRYAPPTRR